MYVAKPSDDGVTLTLVSTIEKKARTRWEKALKDWVLANGEQGVQYCCVDIATPKLALKPRTVYDAHDSGSVDVTFGTKKAAAAQPAAAKKSSS